MPKQKTHKASQRRVRITKNGKILRRQCGVRHLMTNRSPKRKRQLRAAATTETAGYRKKFIAGHCGVR
jgi:large subunit ribosomal protein L35